MEDTGALDKLAKLESMDVPAVVTRLDGVDTLDRVDELDNVGELDNADELDSTDELDNADVLESVVALSNNILVRITQSNSRMYLTLPKEL